MDDMVKFIAVAPDCEIENGIVYILLDRKRVFAHLPHVARLGNERIRKALDKFDAENAAKIVALQ